MPLFLCTWPDGDRAVVDADHVEQALERLDMFGEADASMLRELRAGTFAATFTPSVDVVDGELVGSWGLGELAGELTAEGAPFDLGDAAELVAEQGPPSSTRRSG